MADLSVVAYRDGALDMKRSFDVGAGPSLGLGRVWQALRDLADDGEADGALVGTVDFMDDWESIVMGERDHWRVEHQDEEDGATTVVCEPDELSRIIAAMHALRPHVGATSHPKWDELTAYLGGCAARGGTIAIWYDPMG